MEVFGVKSFLITVADEGKAKKLPWGTLEKFA